MSDSLFTPEQFLYTDRPLDTGGNKDLYWVPVPQRTAALSPPSDTAAVVVNRRVCRCPVCQPKLPGLYRAPDGSPFPRGGRSGKPGEQDDKWPDAPTDIQLESVDLLYSGLFKKKSTRGIVFPIEFTEVKNAKIITLKCRQLKMRWIWPKKFEDFVNCYRFRTDSSNVEVAFFWADKKAQVSQDDDEITIKLIMTLPESFRAAVGDQVRLILERRYDQEGNFHDIACLPEAVTFGQLADYPELARYFGKPDWSLGDVGLFLDHTKLLATFRFPKSRREAIRTWLDKPLIDGLQLGINSRETALMAAMLGLWYVDTEYGKSMDEFIASPIAFLKERQKEKMEHKLEHALEPYKERLARTAYGAVLRELDTESRTAVIALRKNATFVYRRAAAILELLDKIEKVIGAALEALRMYRFVETVLRSDVIYSSHDEYLFLSFYLDDVTHVPNGIVCVNFIPLDSDWGHWHAACSAFANQLFAWESSDAYYLKLLNVDEHVRNYVAAKERENEEGKEVCFFCHEEETYTILHGRLSWDRKCSSCKQVFHSICIPGLLGTGDCHRCLQRSTVESI